MPSVKDMTLLICGSYQQKWLALKGIYLFKLKFTPSFVSSENDTSNSMACAAFECVHNMYAYMFNVGLHIVSYPCGKEW